MAVAILMPSLSPTMTEGNLAKWCKNVGDEIKSGDIIAEVETDKATMEIEAIDEGVLEKVLFDDGAEGISVNSLIAVLRNKNDTDKEVKELLDEHNIEEKDLKKTNVNEDISEVNNNESKPQEIIPVEKEKIEEKSIEINDNEVSNSSEKVLLEKNFVDDSRIAISPLAKRMAFQNNIDITLINGSGPRGRIIKEDISNFINSNNGLNEYSNTIVKKNIRKKASSMRKVIAERLSYSKKEVPHFYLSIDCNVDDLVKGRELINKDLDSESKISINDIIIKALGMSLSKIPDANCSWDNGEINYFGSVDISVAIAVEGGLFTPILKNVEQLNLREISNKMKDFVSRANSGKLLPKEYEGGNFSLSNLGMYGIDSFSAIINPPQSGILAIGSITKKPLVINNEIKISSCMTCKLSGDHRVIDGAVGAKLLKEFKSIIENPIKMIV
ncbi:MAG: pyruvate dehydrogenase complex dihydrolipoamide acetyltransferase [Alphaproteobacteria bacterium]|nr:pyruvate dehydrogenase complex dihydrolipoamide acetyltransferase [Alphaproteobacteria bacterium]